MKYLTLILFVFTFSCTTNSPANEKSLGQRIDTVKIYLEKNQRGIVAPLYNTIKRTEILLGLTSLEQGSDSMELRIWRHRIMNSGHSVLILNYENKKWNAKEYLYSLTIDTIGDEKLAFKEANVIEPRNGWSPVLRNISNLGLEKLSDTIPAPSNIGLMDEGIVYGIEISTKNIYIFKTRILDELDMPLLKDDKLVPLIKLFNSEFNPERW